MNKKILILSLVVTVISLVYIILEYNGTIRKLKLSNISTETYLQKYIKKNKAADRVIISFILPDKIKLSELKPFINSLLDQSIRVDEIVAISGNKVSTGSNGSVLPEEYKKILSFYKHNKNYQGNTGLVVCSILREPDSNTKIILVEYGVIYPDDFIQSMIEKSKENPDQIIYGNKDKNLKGGILIKPGFFTESVTDPKGSLCAKDWIKKCTQALETCCD